MKDGGSVILDSINHRQPRRMAVDFGGSNCSGVHCSVVAELRRHFGLAETPVKVHEPYQMLGLVEDDLAEAMGVDTAHCLPAANMFGVANDFNWKEWRTPWGQDVLVASGMALRDTPEGEVLAYPEGDASAPASAKMPSGGYFFDAIIRQEEFDEDDPDPADNTEEFALLTPERIQAVADNAREARAHGRAVIAGMPGTAFGDVSNVPAVFMRRPRGIRDITEWYVSLATRRDFIHEVFSRQLEVALENLARIHAAVGDDAFDVVFLCGADFGTQISTICSKETFVDLFTPYYKKMNDWIHANTPWKTWKHSCGAIETFIQPLIESGFDILNPVQCSASGMDPARLKKTYGDRIVFWGAGVDTQKTLPFGSPEEVRREVLERCEIFSPDGGFVFNSVHNVQALTPIANMAALLDAVKEFNSAGR